MSNVQIYSRLKKQRTDIFQIKGDVNNVQIFQINGTR